MSDRFRQQNWRKSSSSTPSYLTDDAVATSFFVLFLFLFVLFVLLLLVSNGNADGETTFRMTTFHPACRRRRHVLVHTSCAKRSSLAGMRPWPMRALRSFRRHSTATFCYDTRAIGCSLVAHPWSLKSSKNCTNLMTPSSSCANFSDKARTVSAKGWLVQAGKKKLFFFGFAHFFLNACCLRNIFFVYFQLLQHCFQCLF